MTNEEIQAFVDTHDTISFEAGVYTDLSLEIKGDKKFVPLGVVHLKSSTGKAIGLLFNQNGSLNIAGTSGSEFIVDGYMDGAKINHNVTASMHVGDDTKVAFIHSQKGTGDDSNDGSGIYALTKVNLTISGGKNATFIASDNGNAGIAVLDGTASLNFTGCRLVDLSRNKAHSGYDTTMSADQDNPINSNLLFKDCEEVHADNNGLDGFGFNIGTPYLTFENCKTVTINKNNVWGTNAGFVKIVNSVVDCSGNSSNTWDQVTRSASNMYMYSLTVEGSSLTANDDQSYSGIWVGGDAKITNSTITANRNGNKDAAHFDLVQGGNGIYITGNTEIYNSVIETKDNGRVGLYLAGRAGITKDIVDSKLYVSNNGYGQTTSVATAACSGISTVEGIVNIKNTAIMNTDDYRYGTAFATTYDLSYRIDDNSVYAIRNLDSEIKGAAPKNKFFMLSGSLQAEIDNIHTASYKTWNESKKSDEAYAAPINEDFTKLVRFDLHQTINKEVNKEHNVFAYYDPNTGKKHDYSFRYNHKGEDLDANASGNAYVWAPVSILHYDATEGDLDTMGTAGKLVTGSSKTKQQSEKGRYTSDVTIYGNSLNLAEKTMPTAKREGYTFLGWYVADDEEKAAEYAENKDFEKLYELLNTRFDETSKVVKNQKDTKSAQQEKTIYAKWGYAKGNIEVSKAIQKAEVDFTQGDPIFIIKAVETKTGAAYYRSIRFTANSSEVQTVKFENLSLGEYEISEAMGIRYQFGSVSILDAKENCAKIQGQNVMVDLNKNVADKEEVCAHIHYSNVQVNDKYLSDTDTVVNRFKVTNGEVSSVTQDYLKQDYLK